DSQADLVWARGTTDGVYAARGDFAKAFIFAGSSAIKYAHREWVFLPEGELVTIDRVQTADAQHFAHVGVHANTGAKLGLKGSVAVAPVGGSQLAIHTVSLSGGTPKVVQPMVGNCTLTCDYPCGKCAAARFAVDEYVVDVPGPWAVAVHAFDGVGAAELPA